MADLDQSAEAQQEQACIAPNVSSASDTSAPVGPPGPAPGPAAGDSSNPVLSSLSGTISAESASGLIHPASGGEEKSGEGGESVAKTVFDAAHDGKGDYDMLHEALETKAISSPGLSAANDVAGGIFSVYDLISGANAIAEHKSVESTVNGVTDVVSGGIGTVNTIAQITQAAGYGGTAFGGAASAAATAAGEFAMPVAAFGAGMKVGARGDEETKEWGIYGNKPGVVGPDGKPIAMSITDAAAERAAQDSAGSHADHFTTDENGVEHATKGYEPTFMGGLEAAALSMSQAPVAIAAGLYGMGKDAVKGATNLLLHPVDTVTGAYHDVSNFVRGGLSDEEMNKQAILEAEQRERARIAKEASDKASKAAGGMNMITSAVDMANKVGAMPEGELKEAMKQIVQQQIESGSRMMGGTGEAAAAPAAGGAPENSAG